MQKKPALGKGMGAIFSDDAFIDNINNDADNVLLQVDTALIKPNRFQPRIEFNQDELKDLADSIKEKGVLQPIILRKLNDEEYEIIAGERRWRASKLAGINKVPALIKDVSDNELLELALIENIQRSDLNPVEVAKAYNRLVEELGFTQEEVAEKVGKNRSSVANFLRLLKLPDDVLDMIKKGLISSGHAKVLLGVKSNEICLQLAKKIVNDGLSVRKLEIIVKELSSVIDNKDDVLLSDVSENTVFRDMEKHLAEVLNTKVKILDKGDAGRVIINYSSRDSLDKILNLFSQ